MKTIPCFAVYVWDGGDRHDFKFHLATKGKADKYKEKHKHDDVVPVAAAEQLKADYTVIEAAGNTYYTGA